MKRTIAYAVKDGRTFAISTGSPEEVKGYGRDRAVQGVVGQRDASIQTDFSGFEDWVGLDEAKFRGLRQTVKALTFVPRPRSLRRQS